MFAARTQRCLSTITFGLAFQIGFLLSVAPCCTAQETPQTEIAEPTKQELIKTLKSYFTKLKSGDYEGAVTHLVIPPKLEFKPEMIKGFENSENISMEGIERLEAEAEFGRSADQFEKSRVKRYARPLGIEDTTETYGFHFKTEDAAAEVIALWKDGEFKLIRTDDIRRIEHPKPEILPPKADAPSKKALIATLASLQKCMDEKNYQSAIGHFLVRDRLYPRMMKSRVDETALSAKGIKVLDTKAQFAKAEEILGVEKAAKLVKQVGVEADNCYGLKHSQQEVDAIAVVAWKRDHFQVIFLRDIGKLKPSP